MLASAVMVLELVLCRVVALVWMQTAPSRAPDANTCVSWHETALTDARCPLKVRSSDGSELCAEARARQRRGAPWRRQISPRADVANRGAGKCDGLAKMRGKKTVAEFLAQKMARDR